MTTKALIVSAVLPQVKDDFDRLAEKTSSKVWAALGLTAGPTLAESIREPIKECWNKDDIDKKDDNCKWRLSENMWDLYTSCYIWYSK